MIRALFQTYTARHLHEVTHGFVLVLDFLLIGKRGRERKGGGRGGGGGERERGRRRRGGDGGRGVGGDQSKSVITIQRAMKLTNIFSPHPRR